MGLYKLRLMYIMHIYIFLILYDMYLYMYLDNNLLLFNSLICYLRLNTKISYDYISMKIDIREANLSVIGVSR